MSVNVLFLLSFLAGGMSILPTAQTRLLVALEVTQPGFQADEGIALCIPYLVTEERDKTEQLLRIFLEEELLFHSCSSLQGTLKDYLSQTMVHSRSLDEIGQYWVCARILAPRVVCGNSAQSAENRDRVFERTQQERSIQFKDAIRNRPDQDWLMVMHKEMLDDLERVRKKYTLPQQNEGASR